MISEKNDLVFDSSSVSIRDKLPDFPESTSIFSEKNTEGFGNHMPSRKNDPYAYTTEDK